MSLLSCEKVVLAYDQSDQPVLFIDYFFLNSNDIVGVFGRSGSGKTTFLNALSGLFPPIKGRIMWNSQSLYEMSNSKRASFRLSNIGLIFQTFELIETLTVKENILLPKLLQRDVIDQEYFESILDNLKIIDLVNRLPFQLSGGERQRVAIARSLVTKPTVIFADEPTGNLDEFTRDSVIELFQFVFNKYHIPMIIVSHDKEFKSITTRNFTFDQQKLCDDALVSN